MPPAHQTKSTALNMPFKILPYFYLLPLTTNNPCLGHTEFLNISHVQPCSFTTSVTIQVVGFWLVFVVVLCKIVLWLCKRNPCLDPYALGGSCSDPLLWPPFSNRQAVHGTKVICLHRGCTSPSRPHLQWPGLQCCPSKRPKPASRAGVGLFLYTSFRAQSKPRGWPLLSLRVARRRLSAEGLG